MAIHKEHKEFYTVDLGTGWEVPPGYPAGIEQQILAGSLDEQKKTGFRTRHLRFKPGVYTTAPFVHEYWRRSTSSPVISSSATTRMATAARNSGRTRMRAVRRGPTTVRSSRTRAVSSSSFTTTTTNDGRRARLQRFSYDVGVRLQPDFARSA